MGQNDENTQCMSVRCCCKLISKCDEKPAAPVVATKPRNNDCGGQAERPKQMSLCDFLKSQPIPEWIKVNDVRPQQNQNQQRTTQPCAPEKPKGNSVPEDVVSSQIIINFGTVITNGGCKRDSCQQTEPEVKQRVGPTTVSPPENRSTCACPPAKRSTSKICPAPANKPTTTCSPPNNRPIPTCPPTDKQTTTCSPPTDKPTTTCSPPNNRPIPTCPPTDKQTTTCSPPTDKPTNTCSPPANRPNPTCPSTNKPTNSCSPPTNRPNPTCPSTNRSTPPCPSAKVATCPPTCPPTCPSTDPPGSLCPALLPASLFCPAPAKEPSERGRCTQEKSKCASSSSPPKARPECGAKKVKCGCNCHSDA
ncbi:unnamed protein product [Macrosiphum euphorbiae]|uniref:Uncharacterized protein n=1 Tax=Macrosiphum euphorbiae TaxID=13131 RepID=A0AAV0WTY1_9HEMI|nr:unnamed protein product [Macrosiphum euphorbiae]